MTTTRDAAVAGLFYPADPRALAAEIDAHLASAAPLPDGPNGRAAKAIIAPHAGYVYSGPVAGSAYAALKPHADRIRRVALLGPSHRVPLHGLAAPSAGAFATPLGEVEVDRRALETVLDLPQVGSDDEAHRLEHSLEVQLPFLQTILNDFTLVPLAVGDAPTRDVAEVIDRLYGGPETLLVISSDLSHYHDYATARRLDAETALAIENLEPERLGRESACGRIAVRGLLATAAAHGLEAQTVDLRNSGDTAGGRDEVVGYGAFLFA